MKSGDRLMGDWERRSIRHNSPFLPKILFFVGVGGKLWYDGSNETAGKESSSWQRQQGAMSIW